MLTVTYQEWTQADEAMADRHAIPAYMRRSYQSHAHSSKSRGIPFAFTILGWCLWWKHELARIGPHARRGLQRGQYVMARKGNQGAYEPGNVECILATDNTAQARPRMAEAVKAAWARRKAAGERCWLEGRRGDAHPRAKAIVTPLGRFGSAALAAEAHGITRQAAARKARAGRDGWQVEPGPASL